MKHLLTIGALALGAPAHAHPGHDGLHGIAALDHPLGLVALAVVSGLVLLAASWHGKRRARALRKAENRGMDVVSSPQ